LDQIVVNNPEHTQAIADLVGIPVNPEPISISRVKDDKLLGGVIFYDYTGESLCVHVGAWDDHWINRDMLFCMFDYPFNQMHVGRIFAKIPADNEHSLRFNEKLGFQTVAVIPGVYIGGIDCVLRVIEKPAAERFLRIKPRHIQVRRRLIH
jgi:RimJ/RimL family protein N-acetyltransferase